MLEVYERIEIIRNRKGVTKTHIANKCGKTPAWYTRVSKGKTKLDVDNLQDIANALEVDVRIFFDNKLSVTLTDEKQKVVI